MWSPFKTAATSIRYTVLIEAAPQSTVSRLGLADGSLFLSVGIGKCKNREQQSGDAAYTTQIS